MKDIIKTCGCGLTFREPKEGQGHCPACVTRARSQQSDEVVRANAGEVVTATWSDEARKAAIESRKRHGLEGAKFQDSPEYFRKWADHHENMAEHHEIALHEGPTDKRERSGHEEALEMHDKAAFHYRRAAQYHGTANKDRANHHLSMAERYSVDAKDNSDHSSIHASGNSEGAKKGWELRKGHSVSFHMRDISPHEFGEEGNTAKSHDGLRAKVSGIAIEPHDNNHETGYYDIDFGNGKSLSAVSGYHLKKLGSAKASDASSALEVVHCRSHSALGPVLAASKPWNAGERVEFMWMPAGVSTICAGFRKGSIELTVQCSEETAQAVQASLDEWRNERPKQEPFGCIEHKEQEASFRISASCGFKWGNDGVYLAAEPTTLGAQNVNGKVHRSWSPSFTTDADYASATERDGVLAFPEGARGSRSNPAKITGVDFCVGTLTNKPAFHSMSPVRAKDSKDSDYNRTNGGNQATNEELAISFRNDVPDYTQAELLVYCNRIRKGGSHMEAVTEARATRNSGSAKANEKPTLESIFAKTLKATETANTIAEFHGAVKLTAEDVYERYSVKATWSDAARKAALEARRHSAVALDEPLKRSMDGKPRADLDAYKATKEAHAASKKTATETGKGGYDQDAHNYAHYMHNRAADAHEKAKDSHMAALHRTAADAHKAASVQIHKETWATKASHHSYDADERAQAIEDQYPNKATDATPEAILERIYARAGASR